MHKILFYTSPQGVSLLIRRCCENPRLSNIFLNYVSYTLTCCHLFTRTNTTRARVAQKAGVHLQHTLRGGLDNPQLFSALREPELGSHACLSHR